MATVTGTPYEPGKVISMKSGANYSSTDEHVFVKIDSTDDQAVVCGAGENGIGVRLNKPGSGEAMEVQINGVAMVKLGGTVTVQDLVKSDASGQAVGSVSSGNYYCGQAMRSGVDGDIIPVLLMFGIYYSAG